MSQRDNFAGGFLLGAILGGVVGGALGALAASGRLNELLTSDEEPLLPPNQPEAKPGKAPKRSLKPTNGQGNMEVARRSLEDKIAQLNEAIDDVRQQLGSVDAASKRESPRPSVREPIVRESIVREPKE